MSEKINPGLRSGQNITEALLILRTTGCCRTASRRKEQDKQFALIAGDKYQLWFTNTPSKTIAQRLLWANIADTYRPNFCRHGTSAAHMPMHRSSSNGRDSNRPVRRHADITTGLATSAMRPHNSRESPTARCRHGNGEIVNVGKYIYTLTPYTGVLASAVHILKLERYRED